MNVCIGEDKAWQWMFGDLKEPEITEIAKTQFPAELMEACPIERGYKESEDPFKEFKYADSPSLVV